MSTLNSLERPIRVAVIGLRGHASRHIQRLRNQSDCEIVAVYYPGEMRGEDPNLPVTDEFERCLDSDAVVISSPTSVHTSQLLQLNTYRGHVLLEKPAAATREDIDTLLQLPVELKERVRVNYNFRFHAVAQRFSELAQSDVLGDIFALSIHSSHGGAFREDWRNSWRRSESSEFGPLETVGVHFIQFAADMLGVSKHAVVFSSSMAEESSNVMDTGLLTMYAGDRSWVSIQCSYAAPYAFRMELRGTNGYVEYDGREIRVYSPRSTFDDRGRFASPTMMESWLVDHDSAWEQSAREAQRKFLDVVGRNGRFDSKDFDCDVSVMDVLLQSDHRT